ncbi:GxxExxY protein [Nitrosococcus oceani]|uniref:GxxExxY protein n=1 Tax=Nitrosococcus oceani TaxID=1229 RepID=UPI0004E92867|nr:GxxExxY protein [Nitrosococcus oceani]KFI23679.1 GTP-binding protein [Nitrosococcus oceani]
MNHEIHKNHKNKGAILYKDECYQIQGAIFEVYREMGGGFLESVYQECLEKEFLRKSLPFRKQVEIPLSYKGDSLQQYFRADLICFDSILIELKACKSLDPIHRAQVLNYLKATGLRLGLLVNFSAFPKAVIERIIL